MNLPMTRTLAGTLGLLMALAPLRASSQGAAHTVWVADEGGDSVTVFDASTNAVVATVKDIKGPTTSRWPPVAGWSGRPAVPTRWS